MVYNNFARNLRTISSPSLFGALNHPLQDPHKGIKGAIYLYEVVGIHPQYIKETKFSPTNDSLSPVPPYVEFIEAMQPSPK